ncbi:MAG TPA: hypothetical protein VEI04_07125 [Syntrophobacteria bacterium]|nr:hypothetical protein [Syntrophobacteria bacterium]
MRRLPMARYERLLRPEPQERLPEYAGKRVRCVFVALDLVGRTPLGIRHIDHFMLPFDGDGRIDTSERNRAIELAGEMVGSIIGESPSAKVIDGRGHFARRRYFHEFKWVLTPQLEANIITAIFGKELA